MTEEYVPPAVWTWSKAGGGTVSSLNRPISGATHDKALPVGAHPIQLYSLASPNGQKVTILLEELLEAGHTGAEYDAWKIDITQSDQFSSGFVAINPNSKIPAMVDRSGTEPVRVFESGAMMVHLAEKFGAFLPASGAARAECLSWLMWQMSSAPFIGGGFGHFYAYAPVKLEYAINRYAMETKRLFHVADTRLGECRFLAGDEYTIADMAVFAWFALFCEDRIYRNAHEFLAIDEYANVGRWVKEIAARPAVIRGRMVNGSQLAERHSAADFAAVESAAS